MKIALGKNKITAGFASTICGASLVGDCENEIACVCTDSREAQSECLFCAIIGEKVDGHNYIVSAYENGCRAFLCQKIPQAASLLKDVSFIITNDTVSALGSLARGYRAEDKMTVIGVTGSVGKTTTKEFIAAILPYKSYHTKGNYNSTIGLPLSLMEIPDGIEYAVLEMGMSGRGEIESMSLCARPKLAVITNIGSSHLEMLGSREGIRDAKLEIVKGLKPDGVLLINGDDPMLENAQITCRTIKIGIKNESCDFLAQNIRQSGNDTVFDIVYAESCVQNVKIPTLGEHNVYAALFAFAVAELSGFERAETVRALSEFKQPKMRQNIYELGGITIIEDCYNASPESMRAAIDVLASLKKNAGKTVALLGDMLELGDDSPNMHFEVGKYAAERKIDAVVTFGPLSLNTARGAGERTYAQLEDRSAHTAAAEALLEIIRPADILLFKASRGLAAEKIIEILKERLK